MKSVLLDSSSLILLYKANLLDALCSSLNPRIAPTVFQEISQPHKPGSIKIQEYVNSNRIKLLQGVKPEKQAFNKLDPGERETLSRFVQGQGDYVIIDDLQAIRICVKEEIPFINGLLVPKVLYLAKRISEETYTSSSRMISSSGYYSEKIIRKAESFQKHELSSFLPSTDPK